MIVMDSERTADIPEEQLLVEFDGAYAKIIVSEVSKTVFIQDIEAESTGHGAGTRLLNKLKGDYPDFTISGLAMPYQYDNPHPEITEEEQERYVLLTNEMGFRALSREEQEFVTETKKRYHDRARFNPFARLMKFYRDNHFEIDTSGHFSSKPPHKKREL